MQFSRDSLADPALQRALRVAAIFALIKFAIQIATNLIAPHLGYGDFRAPTLLPGFVPATWTGAMWINRL